MLRVTKISLLASMALFFTLAGFSNWIDFGVNLVAVKHVLSMDTSLHTKLMDRAITNSNIHRFAYVLIFSWEIITGIILWLGCLGMLFQLRQSASQFNKSKCLAYLGLFLGLLLYLVGFLDIGGEWFVMWQSPPPWNAQATAGMFSIILLLILILLAMPEQ